HPTTAVEWSVDTEGNPRREVPVIPKGEVLDIPHVKAGHAGTFTCTALDAARRAHFASFRLSVIEPPMVEGFSFPSELAEGMRTSVACNIRSGSLPIRIRWLKDGHPLSDLATGIQETHGDFYSHLVLTRIQAGHAGRYTCVAQNDAGQREQSAVLHVLVPPKWVVEPEDRSVVAGGRLSVECQAAGFPPPVVAWKRVGGRGESLVKSTEKAVLVVEGASEDAEYACAVENGVSPPIEKRIRVRVNGLTRVSQGVRWERE
ncbi:unnamed protein product, partial [Darwinula stevensoni]